jgi:formate dehydrogenase subunit gamma
MRTQGDFIMRIIASFKGMLAALALVVTLGIAAPAQAQQSIQGVNPTAQAVKEEQLLRQLDAVSGRVSIPDQKSGLLIQPQGREWRQFHNTTMFWVGVVSVLGMIAVLAVFYMTRGKIMIEGGFSGRTILRFNVLERFVHWLTAGCFIILALSGLNVTFGKSVLLPLMGHEAFTALSVWAKYAHNFLAFPFMAGILFMFAVWVKDNIPEGADIAWLKAGGGLIGHEHPPAKKFNGGQKLIFWSVIIGGVALSISGVLLLFPFFATTIWNMQLAQIVHGLVGVLLIAVMLAHAYIGSIGMQGAFDAMGSGEVDLNWAKEHHSLWVQEEEAKKNSVPKGMVAAE